MNPIALLTGQKIISTRQFQSQFAAMANQAKKNHNYYNVVRNGKSVGVFMPIDQWEDLLEDLEALSSPNYLAKIKAARAEPDEDLVALEELIADEDSIQEVSRVPAEKARRQH